VFKLGIAANLDELERAVRERGLDEHWPDDLDSVLRSRSEVVENLAAAVLAHFGDPDAGDRRPPMMVVRKEFENRHHVA
jgi:hypothetical protein